jgi:hypothetical protein
MEALTVLPRDTSPLRLLGLRAHYPGVAGERTGYPSAGYMQSPFLAHLPPFPSPTNLLWLDIRGVAMHIPTSRKRLCPATHYVICARPDIPLVHLNPAGRCDPLNFCQCLRLGCHTLA